MLHCEIGVYTNLVQTLPLNNAKNPDQVRADRANDLFGYLCHAPVKRGHCCSSLVPISKAAVPPSSLCHPSLSQSLLTPPPPGPTWSQSTIKFTESQAPLGISVSICIFARCALCAGLWGGGGNACELASSPFALVPV